MSSPSVPPPPPPPPPRSRFPVWAWIVVAVVVFGAGFLVTLLVTGGSEERDRGATGSPSPSASPAASSSATESASPSASPSVSPSASPSESADPAFDALVAQLPPEVSACQSVAPAGIYEQAQTVASCSLTGHADVETVFVSFATEADARATYDSLLQGAGWEPDTGSCTSDEGGEIGWEGLGASGRIQCFQTGVPETPAGVIWTTDGFPIIGHLTAHTPGTGPSVLYAAWQEISIYGR